MSSINRTQKRSSSQRNGKSRSSSNSNSNSKTTTVSKSISKSKSSQRRGNSSATKSKEEQSPMFIPRSLSFENELEFGEYDDFSMDANMKNHDDHDLSISMNDFDDSNDMNDGDANGDCYGNTRAENYKKDGNLNPSPLRKAQRKPTTTTTNATQKSSARSSSSIIKTGSNHSKSNPSSPSAALSKITNINSISNLDTASTSSSTNVAKQTSRRRKKNSSSSKLAKQSTVTKSSLLSPNTNDNVTMITTPFTTTRKKHNKRGRGSQGSIQLQCTTTTTTTKNTGATSTSATVDDSMSSPYQINESGDISDNVDVNVNYDDSNDDEDLFDLAMLDSILEKSVSSQHSNMKENEGETCNNYDNTNHHNIDNGPDTTSRTPNISHIMKTDDMELPSSILDDIGADTSYDKGKDESLLFQNDKYRDNKNDDEDDSNLNDTTLTISTFLKSNKDHSTLLNHDDGCDGTVKEGGKNVFMNCDGNYDNDKDDVDLSLTDLMQTLEVDTTALKKQQKVQVQSHNQKYSHPLPVEPTAHLFNHNDSDYNENNNATENTPTVTTYDQSIGSSDDKSSNSLPHDTRSRSSRNNGAVITDNQIITTKSSFSLASLSPASSSRRRRRREKDNHQQQNDQHRHHNHLEQPSCFSDGELTGFFVSTQHLEDVLSRDGEDALEEVLKTLGESMSDSKGICEIHSHLKKQNNSLYDSHQNHTHDDSSNNYHQHHHHYRDNHDERQIMHNTSLNANNNHSLDEKYLRAHLKSALIALKSVKAERKDVELNIESLQQELLDFEESHTKIVIEKDQKLERVQRELEEMKNQLKHSKHVESSSRDDIQLELDESKGRLLLAELDIDSKTQIINELENKVKLAEDQGDELSALQSRLAEALTKIDMTELKVQLKEEENMRNEDTIESLKTSIAEMNLAKNQKEEEISKLEKQFKDAGLARTKYKALYENAHNNDLRYLDELNVERDARSKLESKLEEISKQVIISSEEISYYKGKLAENKNKLEESTDKVKRLELQLQELRTQKDIGDIMIKKGRAYSTAKELEVQQANEKVRSFELQLHRAHECAEQHIATIDRLNTQLVAKLSEDEIEQMETALKESRSENWVKENKLQEAYEKIKAGEEKLKDLNECTKQQLGMIDALNDELTSKRSDEEKTKMEVIKLKASLEESCNEVQLRTSELQEAAKKAEVTMKVSKQQLDTIDILNSELTALRESKQEFTLQESKLDEAVQKIHETKVELELARDEINRSKIKVSDLNAELKQRLPKEETDMLQKLLQELRSDVAQKQTQLDETLEQTNSVISDLQKANDSLHQNHETMNALKLELTSQVTKTKDSNEKIKKLELDLLESQRYKDKLIILEEDLNQARKEIDEKIEVFNKCDTERMKLMDALEDSVNKYDAKVVEVQQAHEEIKTFELQLGQAHESTQQHIETIDSLTTKLELMETVQRESRSENDKAYEMIQAKESRLKLSDERIKQQLDTIDALNAELASKVSDEENHINTITQLKAALQESKNEYDLQESKLQNYLDHIESIETKLKEADEESNQKLEAIDALNSELTSKVSKEEEFVKEINELRMKLEESNSENNAQEYKLQDALEQQLDTIGALNAELASKVSDEENHISTITQLEAALQESKNEYALQKSMYEEAHQKIESMEHSLGQYRLEIVTLNTELLSLTSNLERRSTEQLKLPLQQSKTDTMVQESCSRDTTQKINMIELECQQHLDTIDDLNTELASQLSIIKKYDERIQELEEELQETNKENDSKQSKLNEEVRKLEANLQNSQIFSSICSSLKGCDSNDNDSMRRVIMELVDEIALVKSAREVLCAKCMSLEPVRDLLGHDSVIECDSLWSDKDQNSSIPLKHDTILSLWNEAQVFQQEIKNLNEELKIADSTAEVESERADAAEEMVKRLEIELADSVERKICLENESLKVKDRMWMLVLNTIRNVYPTLHETKIPAQGSQSITQMIEALEIMLNATKKVPFGEVKRMNDEKISTSPISSLGGNDLNDNESLDFNSTGEDHELDNNDSNASFISYLRGQLYENSVLIRSALHDMETETQGNNLQKYDDEDLTIIDLHSVDFKKYESLKRKCDMLVAKSNHL